HPRLDARLLGRTQDREFFRVLLLERGQYFSPVGPHVVDEFEGPLEIRREAVDRRRCSAAHRTRPPRQLSGQIQQARGGRIERERLQLAFDVSAMADVVEPSLNNVPVTE